MAFDFEIALRNKSGTHLENLKKDLVSVSWRYDALGGCGDCEIILNRDFDDFGDIDHYYGIEIYEIVDVAPAPPIFGSTFDLIVGEAVFGGGVVGGPSLPTTLPFLLAGQNVLRYSGFVRQIQPVLAVPETVRLAVSGYSRQLEYVSVTKKTPPYGPVSFSGLDVGEIARQVIDTYVTPQTKIMRSTGADLCQNTGVVVTGPLNFNDSAWGVLKTLAEIGGNCEWGVRADREIYFLPRSTAVKQTWPIGGHIEFLQPSVGSTDDIVNRVYLEGGFVAGVPFRAVLELSTPETGFVSERHAVVPAITTAGDASLWGLGYAGRFAAAKNSGRIKIAAIDLELSGQSNWIEKQINQNMPPLGLLRVIGAPTFLRAGVSLPFTLPATLTSATAGGNTDITFRINAINYTPIHGGLGIDIELGERSSRIADLFRGIDFKINDLRQARAA